mmetsp:Transcript_11827/g.20281  ORF Transcript_11827/g.20281 Transcript_11827/m.20281 type:complete len:310 (+) Transcript_11827:300-1229(+)|eukprot:CAMPEP_0184700776 /NCGR_PEP_ID=MMETSP0313-20130426/16003_1 /TAXON_ID=2792 /ORGANISM="Porphyridium aerugineum, Strain SAG 1380-2" /LENGTH=309 /DNA_ID=CAMNT_0027160591 /DNA_START=290 /DNA_END=1219 /DNA_ORIENTATION=+
MSDSSSRVAIDLAAGTCAGIAQLFVGHPFDTIKVKLQNMPMPQPGQPPMYTSAMDAVRKTIAEEGIKGGLYKGMGAPFATVAVFNAILFATNGFMKTNVRRFGNVPDGEDLSIAQYAVCGTGAGVAVSFVATPTELVKCRLQAQSGAGASGTAAVMYSGPIDVARKTFASKGLPGLFKGLAPTLARELPGNTCYFAAYEGVKKGLASAQHKSTKELGVLDLMTAGSFAGLAFWGSVYPMDVIKTRIQTDSDMNPKYRGILDCTRQIVKAEGVSALYRGVGPCLARSVPANAICFVVYEYLIKKFAAWQS